MDIYRCEAPVSAIPVWIFGSAKRDSSVKKGFFWETHLLCLKGYLLHGQKIFSLCPVSEKDN